MKIYTIHNDVASWLKCHRDIIYDDILDACDSYVNEDRQEVPVLALTTNAGVSIFSLYGYRKIIDSLQKCESYYITTEEYEKAAIARDCARIYIKKLSD